MCGRFKRKLMNKVGIKSTTLSSRKDSEWKIARQKSHMAQKNSLGNTESIARLLDGSKNEQWTRPVHWLTLDHHFKPVLTSSTFHHLHTLKSILHLPQPLPIHPRD